MKKIVLTLAALAAFTGSAMAADMAPRYTKAPVPMAVAPNWTGFYIFGGGGGGLWASDEHTQSTASGLPLSIDQRQGGSGWFGTVGVGYDWQVNSGWVAGIFADGQFGSIRGTLQDPTVGWTSTVKMQDAWAAGARVGYLVAPNVLSYVNGGYSGSHWSGSTFLSATNGAAVGDHTNSFNRNGWFI
ncbi:MAG: outer membrane protein, partial [Xanthobacteraceae bacterium]